MLSPHGGVFHVSEQPLPAKSNWVPVHSNLRSHPKLSALRRELDLDKLRIPIKWQRHITRVFLIDFWHWTLDNYPDGDITGVESDLIAEGCNYPSDPDAFVEALVTAGFIDRMQDGRLLVHDWEEYGGRLEKRRDAGRVRKERERNKEDVTPHVTPHVTRDIHHQVTPEVTPHVTPPQERTGQNKKDRSLPVVQSKTPDSEQEVTEVTPEKERPKTDDGPLELTPEQITRRKEKQAAAKKRLAELGTTPADLEAIHARFEEQDRRRSEEMLENMRRNNAPVEKPPGLCARDKCIEPVKDWRSLSGLRINQAFGLFMNHKTQQHRLVVFSELLKRLIRARVTK